MPIRTLNNHDIGVPSLALLSGRERRRLAGIQPAETIIAAKKDEDASIFNVTKVGLVGHPLKILPDLTN